MLTGWRLSLFEHGCRRQNAGTLQARYPSVYVKSPERTVGKMGNFAFTIVFLLLTGLGDSDQSEAPAVAVQPEEEAREAVTAGI